MLAVAQHISLCAFALLTTFVWLGIRALRPHVRFESSDPDVIEEIRMRLDADLEARHLATDARHLSGV